MHAGHGGYQCSRQYHADTGFFYQVRSASLRIVYFAMRRMGLKLGEISEERTIGGLPPARCRRLEERSRHARRQEDWRSLPPLSTCRRCETCMKMGDRIPPPAPITILVRPGAAQSGGSFVPSSLWLIRWNWSGSATNKRQLRDYRSIETQLQKVEEECNFVKEINTRDRAGRAYMKTEGHVSSNRSSAQNNTTSPENPNPEPESGVTLAFDSGWCRLQFMGRVPSTNRFRTTCPDSVYSPLSSTRSRNGFGGLSEVMIGGA